MSAIEQIERLIEQLPSEDFTRLTAWIDQRRQLYKSQGSGQKNGTNSNEASSPKYTDTGAPLVLRDHGAFLNSYAPEEEGLYDDAPSR